MSSPEPRSRVTVEDLLRLKRAERPDPEFWTKFEAELRQKQLAALVERRRWWETLPQLFARRAYVPIGAAAVLTFTVVSVRTYTPVASIDAEQQVRPARSVAAEIAPRADMLSSVADSAPPAATAVAAVEPAEESAPVQLSEQLPARSEELVPWGATRTEDTPSARSIAKNLASLAQTEPELANSLLPARVGDNGLQQVAAQVVEFAAVGAVASRRSRLLAQFGDRQFTQDPTAPEVVRERLARRLGDTELTGGWTRVGLKADRVSLKF